MLGIIKKDLYETIVLKKNLFGLFISVFTFLVLIAIADKNVYMLALVVGVTFPMNVSSVIQCSIEQDEISKFNDILLTYPLSRKEIILAKFLASGIFACGIWVFNLIITLIYIYGFQTTDLQTGLLIWFFGILVSIFVFSFSSVGFFFLGNKKGNVLYFLMVIIAAISYIIVYFGVDLSFLFTINLTTLAIAVTFLLILLLICSYYLCVFIYTRKYAS